METTNLNLTTEDTENLGPARSRCVKCRGRTRNPEINGVIHCLNCMPASQKRPPNIVYSPDKIARLNLQYKMERETAKKNGAMYTYTNSKRQYPPKETHLAVDKKTVATCVSAVKIMDKTAIRTLHSWIGL